MSGEEQTSQDACGCCAGVGIQAPALLYNRPGLAAIAYRIGTHSEVLASLQARLSSQDYPALAKLRTRDSDDFSIALLDAYACMADVLSFYQERLANESYLRTAGERLSLSELARLIGYRLKPGVAAETYLAFTLQEAPPQAASAEPKQATGVPDKVKLDIGIKVQSIPGPDEKPQTFESVESIEARPEWNAIKPRLTQPQILSAKMNSVILQGIASNLKPGESLLIVSGTKTLVRIMSINTNDKTKTTRIDFTSVNPLLSPAVYNRPLLPKGNVSDFPTTIALDENVLKNIISKTWSEEDLSSLVKIQGWSVDALVSGIRTLSAKQSVTLDEGIFIFHQHASIFGCNAPKMVTYDATTHNPKPASDWDEWPLANDEGETKLFLDSAYGSVLPGGYIAIEKPGRIPKILSAEQVMLYTRTAYGVSSKTTRISLAQSWWDIWSNWQSLGGVLTSDPATVSWGDGRIDVFVRGTDNALWHKWFNGTWSGWESLGGVLSSGPDVSSWAAGRLDVFVRGADNALWHKWFNGTWSGWESLGGVLTSDPAAVSWGDGRIDVFVRGTDNALWHKWFDGVWSGWESLGGTLSSGPDVSSWAAGRLDVFVRGADNALWHKWFNGTWSGWESLGGVLTSDPAAVSWGDGRIDVFVRGTDNALWHKWFDGVWSGWESLGGTLSSGPDVSSWAAGRLDVFVRGADNALWHKWFDGLFDDKPVKLDALRDITVHAQSERIALADVPIEDLVQGDTISLDRIYLGLKKGRRIILTGERSDLTGVVESETVQLKDIVVEAGFTVITLDKTLDHSYLRDTVAIYANVARATHGETTQETIGSGAARQSHQRYTLKHTPLTFVGAENETGAEAALEVRVNDILWHETPTLYKAGADDRSYVLHVEEDGAGTIQFGDGHHGARLPTGQDNLRVVYRKGIGTAGNLQAGQLAQLLSRPLGLKAVSNPLPAAGGVDADSAADARRNMPLGVRTLGRVVSVQDYEDYARAYTGIAKAQAAVLNTRAGRTVFISITGDDGGQPPDSTLDKLLDSLKQNGDPLVHCETAAYNQATFHIALRIKRDPDHDAKKVLADVEAALRAAFSFDARDFGQIVSRSEIIAVAQEVDGVLGVDLDRFYRGTAITLEERLTPAAATTDAQGNGVAAEILLLDNGPFDYLEEMT
ncbi:putative baseplate assembly protein [Candidatus Nitrotoga sp. 1052]|uniref:putative baseplate assembly protein n=1 Tax=Candidatus Nitrotoga sp. 1052 TaxID=2886964 RepID=UPI001EF70799|nr:putative baseplate assembly protein [Candidatus Nitrotoga sp. 1052]CAH1087662.1 putative baseplate assembly protein [Candidatus Nitrotoga sp. 1052]